jgi:hypothetical protein
MTILTTIVFFSCKKEGSNIEIPSPSDTPTEEPPVAPVFLKDIVIENLPSPYYQFEYNSAGKISRASFANKFIDYDVEYNDNKIIVLKIPAQVIAIIFNTHMTMQEKVTMITYENLEERVI